MSFIIFPGVITPPLTPGAVPYGTGSTVLMTAQGTLGQVLVSQGANPPIWGAGAGSFDAIASGTLTDGSTVIVNANGTVSVVGGTLTPIDPPTAGTPVVFNSANSEYTSIAYDNASGTVVVAYASGPGTGTAIVGTVSGTTISFGTPAAFTANNVQGVSIAYDSNAQKVVIAYNNQALIAGYAVVGTVSGTSISFGTPVQFTSNDAENTSIAYDPNSQKVVIAYRNASSFNNGFVVVGTVSGTSISFGTPISFGSNLSFDNSSAIAYDAVSQNVVVAFVNQSNDGYARVGTVSGTTITFGTSVFYNASAGNAIVYDPIQQKVVIVYRVSGSIGQAVVGTVSGTTISFGTPVTYESGVVNSYVSAAYDSASQRIIIGWWASSSQLVKMGTVSGTSITFGTNLTIQSGALGFRYNQLAFDPNANRAVIVYRNDNNSDYGTSAVITTTTSVSNLTSENFVGFSNGNYTNGQTATIQSVGSIDDAQTGLTPGQSYYVNPAGGISLSPGSPSVFAGTAIDTTKIIVKG